VYYTTISILRLAVYASHPPVSYNFLCKRLLYNIMLRKQPTAEINSALHPSGVGKSSTGLSCWGLGGARSHVLVDRCDPKLCQETLRSSEIWVRPIIKSYRQLLFFYSDLTLNKSTTNRSTKSSSHGSCTIVVCLSVR